MALIEDVKTVHYATKDPIQNYKVRVTLTRLSVQRAATNALTSQGIPGQWPQLSAQAMPAVQTVPTGPGMGGPMQQGIAPLPGPMPQSTAAPVAGAAPASAAPAPASAAPLPVHVAGPAAQPTQDPFLPPQAQAAVADPFGAAQAAQQPQDPFYAPLGARLAQRSGGGRPLGEGMETMPYGQAPYPYSNLAGGPGPTVAMQPMQGSMSPPEQQLVQPFVQSPTGSPMPVPFQQQPMQLVPPPYSQQPPLPYMQQTFFPTPAMPTPAMQQPNMQAPMQGPVPGMGGLLQGGPGYGPLGLPLLGPNGLPLPLPGYGYAPGPYPEMAVDPVTGQLLGPLMPPMGPPVVLPPPPGFVPPVAQPLVSVPTASPQVAAPHKFEVVRVFSWQEKVFSRTEVVNAQQAALAAAAGQDTYGADQVPAQRRGKRTMALGSLTAADLQSRGTRLDPKAQGSVLFTYVHSDEFCEREELLKTVTTSSYEQEARLYASLMASAKSRQEVLNFRTMYIMADLGGEADDTGAGEKILVCIKAYPDGSFDMRPGFSKPGKKYRFEDDHGGIYEYAVEDAGAKAEPSLARRTAKLQRQVAARAAELRNLALGGNRFTPPPTNPEAMRLVVLGEIMGAADFLRQRLYVEYVLRFDPTLWEMESTSWEPAEPGIYRGVTAVSKVRQYPEDPASNTSERWVAHWAHPLEFELVSRGAVPGPAKYPALFLQACSYDLYNRYTSEGYGWMGLAECVPGSKVHYVKCWRPLASQRDLAQEYFIGGSAELQDITHLERGPGGGGSGPVQGPYGPAGAPPGPASRLLNKYGLRTETTGTVKVRLHCITQRWIPAAELEARVAALSGGGAHTSPTRTPGKRNKREMTLAMVVDRARNRLRDARGGDVIIRPGAVSEVPVVRLQPKDAHVAEGSVATFNVTATGMEPLKYMWYKDDKKLTVATADSPSLIIAEVSPLDAGVYYCQVSNKDGAANSAKAQLKVDKVTRAARALGPLADDSASLSSRATGRAPGDREHSSAGGGGPSASRLAPVRMSRLAAAGQRRISPSTSQVGLVALGGTQQAAVSGAGAPVVGPLPLQPAGTTHPEGVATGQAATAGPQSAGGAGAEAAGLQPQPPVGSSSTGGAGGAIGANGLRRKPSRTSISGGGALSSAAPPEPAPQVGLGSSGNVAPVPGSTSGPGGLSTIAGGAGSLPAVSGARSSLPAVGGAKPAGSAAVTAGARPGRAADDDLDVEEIS